MKRTLYLFSMVFSTLFMSCNIEPLSELPERNPRIGPVVKLDIIEETSVGSWVSVTIDCYDAPLEGIYAEVDNKTDWIYSVYIDETYEISVNEYNCHYRFVVRCFVDNLEGKDWRSGRIYLYNYKNDECMGYITIEQNVSVG